jgi:UDP-N-acetylglucosamine 2-epimerase (non-hydrolysing)
MNETRLLHVAGARPNFMKVAPVIAAVDAWNATKAPGAGEAARRASGPGLRFSQSLVHTGQHYDDAMSGAFFRDLGLPEPEHYLEVGSGSHAQQTAEVLRRLEPVLLAERPDLVVVVGDVNSTVAAALCAAKLQIPVAHIEAGLRSRDRTMPEELNRLLTDQLAELLFTTSADADDNLAREGIPRARIHLVGNTMIDTLERLRARVRMSDALQRHSLTPRGYALVTMHRPSNVDEPQQLALVSEVLAGIAQRLPAVFPVHARTRARLAETGLLARLEATPGLTLSEPLGYLDFVALMSSARLVLTDSGGVQEETTVLGVPCLTMRTTTERPVTVTDGTNRLVDPYDAAAVLAAVGETLAAPFPEAARRPPLWEGHAAERIVDVIAGWARQLNLS